MDVYLQKASTENKYWMRDFKSYHNSNIIGKKNIHAFEEMQLVAEMVNLSSLKKPQALTPANNPIAFSPGLSTICTSVVYN